MSAVTLVAGAVGWGLVVVGLRERAVRAETDATLRTEQARQQARQHAREEIAREMHDVLAHRLSLLSMHAGALEYAPGAPPEQLAEAVGVIRHSATRALEDLQDVLKVLRAPVVGDHTEPPQPTHADVVQLIEESAPRASSSTFGNGSTTRSPCHRRWPARPTACCRRP